MFVSKIISDFSELLCVYYFMSIIIESNSPLVNYIVKSAVHVILFSKVYF